MSAQVSPDKPAYVKPLDNYIHAQTVDLGQTFIMKEDICYFQFETVSHYVNSTSVKRKEISR